MSAEKFCNKCRYSREELQHGADQPQLVCDHPRNFVVHFDRARYLVTGERVAGQRIRRAPDILTLRQERPDVCGPEGAWYEGR